MTTSRANEAPLQKLVTGFMAGAVIGLGLLLFLRGSSFYLLDLEARVEHPEFRKLRPSGFIGHGYGIAGTGLILTNLLYLVRRKLAHWKLGSMRAWLDGHVLTGLLGSVLVLFHSALQVRTTIAATTSVSLAVVVLTGVVGRFLYALAPKREVHATVSLLADVEFAVPGLGGRIATALKEVPPYTLKGEARLIPAIFAIPRWRRSAKLRRRTVRNVINASVDPSRYGRADRRKLKKLFRSVEKSASQEVRSIAAATILRSWRSMHRFFAILMVLAVTIHIGVAWYYGYRWIWEEE